MTAFVPSTKVTVYRGTTTNEWGDEVDGLDEDLIVAEGVPVAIVEGTSASRSLAQIIGRSVEGREGGVVEEFTLRFRPGVDVVEQDRVRDERSDVVYLITEMYYPQWTVGAADVRAVAQRVGATSQPVNG